MSKEVIQAKAEDISKILYEAYDVPSGICEQIKDMVQRLEAIANANPSEALKHFNHFEKWYRKICYRVVTSFELDYDLETIKQYILKTQKQEKENAKLKGQVNYLTEVVSEFQKILSIIKKKGVDVGYLKTCKTLEEYNSNCWDDEEDFNKKLTQEEFNLLKEVFK